VLAWIGLLAEGSAALRSGGAAEPGEDWLRRCQESDTRLRELAGEPLRDAFLAPDGGAELRERLEAARRDFEQAGKERGEALAVELERVARGRTALRGYKDAGDRVRAGALFLQRRA
jgi:hypothetical protein